MQMPKTKTKMNNKVSEILAASGGAFAGGAAMKLMKKADGTTNPIAALASAGIGTYLVLKGKNNTMKAVGLGLAGVGFVGIVGKVAEKVPAMGRFAPSIGGLGDLYEDEDGNLVELDGLAGSPQLVQDDNGQTYMIEGVDGDEDMDDLVGLDGDDEYYDDDEYELEGLAGDLNQLVA